MTVWLVDVVEADFDDHPQAETSVTENNDRPNPNPATMMRVRMTYLLSVDPKNSVFRG